MLSKQISEKSARGDLARSSRYHRPGSPSCPGLDRRTLARKWRFGRLRIGWVTDFDCIAQPARYVRHVFPRTEWFSCTDAFGIVTAVARERPLRRRDRILGRRVRQKTWRETGGMPGCFGKAYGRSSSFGNAAPSLPIAWPIFWGLFLGDRKPNEKPVGPRRKSFDPFWISREQIVDLARGKTSGPTRISQMNYGAVIASMMRRRSATASQRNTPA